MAKCQHTGCKVEPSYGTEYCRPLYCVNHALDGMVPTRKKRRTREQFEEMLQQALVEGNGTRTKNKHSQTGHAKLSVCVRNIIRGSELLSGMCWRPVFVCFLEWKKQVLLMKRHEILVMIDCTEKKLNALK